MKNVQCFRTDLSFVIIEVIEKSFVIIEVVEKTKRQKEKN